MFKSFQNREEFIALLMSPNDTFIYEDSMKDELISYGVTFSQKNKEHDFKIEIEDNRIKIVQHIENHSDFMFVSRKLFLVYNDFSYQAFGEHSPSYYEYNIFGEIIRKEYLEGSEKNHCIDKVVYFKNGLKDGLRIIINNLRDLKAYYIEYNQDGSIKEAFYNILLSVTDKKRTQTTLTFLSEILPKITDFSEDQIINLSDSLHPDEVQLINMVLI